MTKMFHSRFGVSLKRQYIFIYIKTNTYDENII